MANSCNCKGDIGGTTCPEGHYAICQKINKKCMGYCIPKISGMQPTEMANYFLNHIRKTSVPIGNSLVFDDLNVLRVGELDFLNDNGENVEISFKPPADILENLTDFNF